MTYPIKRFRFGVGIVVFPADTAPKTLRRHIGDYEPAHPTRRGAAPYVEPASWGAAGEPDAAYIAFQRSLTERMPGGFKTRYGVTQRSRRDCAHCNKRLPADAHAARRYCSDTCRALAYKQRRAG